MCHMTDQLCENCKAILRERNRVAQIRRRKKLKVSRSVENFPVTKGESSGAIAGVAPKSGISNTFRPHWQSDEYSQ